MHTVARNDRAQNRLCGQSDEATPPYDIVTMQTAKRVPSSFEGEVCEVCEGCLLPPRAPDAGRKREAQPRMKTPVQSQSS